MPRLPSLPPPIREVSGMMNTERRRIGHGSGRDLFWNPLARTMILLLILIALALLVANGIGNGTGECAAGTMIETHC
ncbi:MAG: hypothetical protein AMJ59_04840 [Gammaproteobacteria bacterium SG8_31]|jgi:hypothetical protein|nr:MAG: hypothetical protein AMJ59_04840 [Gammaproteobacteria bacterium SG8_31]